MIRYLLLVTSFIFSVCVQAQGEQLPLMPWPQTVVQQEGKLVLGNKWKVAIAANDKKSIEAALKRSLVRVEKQTGQKIRWQSATEKLPG
jgi:hexosaminidase